MDSAVLYTGRLLLRKFQEADLEQVYEGLSHPEVIKYYGVSYSTLEETKVQMKWFEDLEVNKTGQWWAICSKEGRNAFLGGIGLNNLNPEHKKAEIGFWLLPEFWGKGFVAEAAEAVQKYAYDHLNLHRIEAFVETENHNSARVLKKLKFQHEGRMKDGEIKNGKFISVDIFARIKEG